MCICLRWPHFSPVLLTTRSLLFTSSHILCLLTPCTTSSLGCWSLSLLNHSFFRTLLTRLASLLVKIVLPLLVIWILYLSHRTLLQKKEDPEAKTLLQIPGVQTVVNLQDLSTPPQGIPPYWENPWVHHLDPHDLDYHPLSHAIMLDILQISPGSIIGAYVEKHSLRTGQALAASPSVSRVTVPSGKLLFFLECCYFSVLCVI